MKTKDVEFLSEEEKVTTAHKALDSCIEKLAHIRAICIYDGMLSEEEVTEYINQRGEYYAKKFADMGDFGLFIYRFSKLMDVDFDLAMNLLKKEDQSWIDTILISE